ncbi:hypothetical protein GCM10022221_80930 [Actinocorallia aurea]
MSVLKFTDWTRTPLGAAITGTDAATGRAKIDVGADLVGPGPDGQKTPVAPPGDRLQLLGPGDVAGCREMPVLRAFPPAGTADAAPNDLASVDLAVPELPWLLTPTATPTDGRLQPWIVLVVVSAETRLDPGPGALPVLHASTAELPDLAEAWAWAHVQESEEGQDRISRLICPRRLDGHRKYRACIVPALRSGVAAGLSALGKADPAALRDHSPAWRVKEPARVVDLPVYWSWEFETGPDGDFEHVVRRLRAAGDASGLTAREVDICCPWPGKEPLPGGAPPPDGNPLVLTVDGAMRPIRAAGAEAAEQPPTAVSTDFEKRIQAQLSAPADRLESGADPADQTGAVAPPLYGGRHVGVDRVGRNPELPLGDHSWIDELNLAPGRRIAAGLGAAYVRDQQEHLMTRAWEQVGAVREANRLRAMAGLATAVSASIHDRRISSLTAGELIAFTAPAAARVHAGQETLALQITASPMPDAVASAAFTRLMRPTARIAQRSGTTLDSVIGRGLAGQLAARVLAPVPAEGDEPAAAEAEAPPPFLAARRLIRLEAVRRVAAANGEVKLSGALTRRLEGLRGVSPELLARSDARRIAPVLAGQIPAVGEALREAAADAGDTAAAGEPSVRMSAEDVAQRLLPALHPGDRILRRMGTRITAPESAGSGSGPIMAYPVFDLPMALALAESAQEWLLPGLEDFPPESVALVEANNSFIESYLTGLNQEMMAELLWREYPTDRRGSPFRRFWPRTDVPGDVPALDAWESSPLGSHVSPGDGDFSLVLVRGEVVRRFPDMVVTAARAMDTHRPDKQFEPSTDDVRPCLFPMRIDDWTIAYAFALPPGELADPASEGWFFVFQEHDYRMRFGFDTLGSGPGNAKGGLSWDDVGDKDRENGFAVAEKVGRLTACGIAKHSIQQPYQVAIHSSLLIQTGGRDEA